MKKLEILLTADGGKVSEYMSAFDFATSLLCEAGFELDGVSSLSRSRYFNRRGQNDRQIRLADHDNRHPGARDHIVELELTARRETVQRELEFDGEAGPEIAIEEEYELVIVEGE